LVCIEGTTPTTPKDGWYLVQLFEWMMGEESCCYLVEIEAMRDWIFYKNAESMQHSYHDGVAYHVGKNNA